MLSVISGGHCLKFGPHSHREAIDPFHLCSSFWNTKLDYQTGRNSWISVSFLVHMGMQLFCSAVASSVSLHSLFSNNNTTHFKQSDSHFTVHVTFFIIPLFGMEQCFLKRFMWQQPLTVLLFGTEWYGTELCCITMWMGP